MPFPPSVDADSASFLLPLSIATALGALLGTQREMLQQRWNVREFGGIRSFMMLSIAGLLSAYLASSIGTWFIGLIGLATSIFLAIGYAHKLFRSDQAGVTSELAGVLTFLVGVLTYHNATVAITVGVSTTFIIALKDPLHRFVSRLSPGEFLSTAEFVLFAFVILPILPNRAIDRWGIFNPYEFWVLILTVLGVSFSGYVATKLFGNRRGLLLAGILGGTVSSTAVTNAMSVRSAKDERLSSILTSATIAANVVMVMRIGIVLFFLSFPMLRRTYPSLVAMLAVALGGLGWSLYRSWRQGKDDHDGEVIQRSPFSLWQAVKFGGFVLAVLVLSFVLRTLFGVQGVYLTALITGLVDVDAFILSMVHLTVQDPQMIGPASYAVLIAAGSNMVVKSAITFFFGNRTFAWKVASVLLGSVAAALVVALAM